MSELAAFLLARITAEESVAQAATQGPWNANTDGVWVGDDSSAGIAHASWELDQVTAADFAHIASQDPARTLARCAAYLRILERCGPYLDPFSDVADRACTAEHDLAEDTLRALASVYADHPDYRQEWKP